MVTGQGDGKILPTVDPLEIRDAGPDDLVPLLELYRHLNPDEEPPPLSEAAGILERFSRYPESAILIGYRDREAVASCSLVVVPNLTRSGRPYALIENVVTHAAHRGKGYGRALLATAVEAAWQAGCYKAMLLTGARDPAVLRFYEGAGFEQTKTGFEVRRHPRRRHPRRDQPQPQL